MALKRKLVIVGGGCVGSLLSLHLENEFLVTLIDNKSYLEFTPAKLSMLVDPNRKHSLRISHSSYLSKSIIVQGSVSFVSEKFVSLSTGEKFYFDFLVLCTGTRYVDAHLPFISTPIGNVLNRNESSKSTTTTTNTTNSSPFLNSNTILTPTLMATSKKMNNQNQENNQSIYNSNNNTLNGIVENGRDYHFSPSSCLFVSARADNLEQYHFALEQAKQILVIGGGLVGIELAAEICTTFDCLVNPNKQNDFRIGKNESQMLSDNKNNNNNNGYVNSKKKQLFLIHSHERLFSHGPLSVSDSAFNFLQNHGVQIILGERVVSHQGK
jgi:NADH dehydrogenase FAD-containing subunit